MPRCAPQAPPASTEAADQAAASAELGLAVLASFCRVPALAESQDAIEKAPYLLRVREQRRQDHRDPGICLIPSIFDYRCANKC